MNVNGKELAIEIDGPDDAPVVLLVHGLGGTSNFYQPRPSGCGWSGSTRRERAAPR